MTPTLSCRSLHAGYENVTVVRDFDLDLEAGSIVALVGPNAAGKTTLLPTTAGLLPQLQGDILVDRRRPPSGRPAPANRAGVVLAPAHRSLFTTLSVPRRG